MAKKTKITKSAAEQLLDSYDAPAKALGEALDAAARIGAIVHYIYCRRWGSLGFDGWLDEAFGHNWKDIGRDDIGQTAEAICVRALRDEYEVEDDAILGLLYRYLEEDPSGTAPLPVWLARDLELEEDWGLPPYTGPWGTDAEGAETDDDDDDPPFEPATQAALPAPEAKPAKPRSRSSRPKDLPGQAELPLKDADDDTTTAVPTVAAPKDKKAPKAKKPPSLAGKTVRFRPTGKKYFLGTVVEDAGGDTVVVEETKPDGATKRWPSVKRGGVKVITTKLDAADEGDAGPPTGTPDVAIVIPADEYDAIVKVLASKTGFSKKHPPGEPMGSYKATYKGYAVWVEAVNGDPDAKAPESPRAFVDVYVNKGGSSPTFEHKPSVTLEEKYRVVVNKAEKILAIVRGGED